jgi:propionyl-CoA carboxylase alpha chain
MRKAMGAQAVALSKAVDYDSAGTVEFIVDKDKNFYFLEMNTRLQVEHPVTELITGIDLVEQMLKVADGEKLELGQKDVKLNGWAIESRIYAEDPYRNFLPSIGRLRRYQPPEEFEGDDGSIVRNDTGVTEGSEISLFYDPMIAKLCTFGPDRAAAIQRMAEALDEFHVAGIQHNVPFLQAVIRHPRFQSGAISTNFIAEEYPDGFHGAELLPEDFTAFVAVAALAHARITERNRLIDGQLSYDTTPVDGNWTFMLGLTPVPITITDEGDEVVVSVDEGDHPVPAGPIDFQGDWMPGEPVFRGEVNGRVVSAQLQSFGIGWNITHAGRTLPIHVVHPRTAELLKFMPRKKKGADDKELKCPMPGVVVSIAVEEGDEVQVGQNLAVVEAMKMENVLTSEVKGIVKKILAKAGDSLAVDDVIIEFA